MHDESDRLNEMRLLIDGALSLYEDETTSLMLLARKNAAIDAALALDAIGTVLYSVKQQICDMQRKLYTESA